MSKKGLSAKEFASWLAPHDALQQVAEVAVSVSASGPIFDRLKGGLIVAVAAHASWVDEHEKAQHRTMFEIPMHYWEWMHSEDIWQTGDIWFAKPTLGISLTNRQEIFRCFTVRLDPKGVHGLINSLPKKRAPDPLPPTISQSQTAASEGRDAIPRLRPVSEV